MKTYSLVSGMIPFLFFWVSPIFAQDVCDLPPGGDIQILQTSVWGGPLSGDFFSCGTTATPTPLTCTLYNRVYTDQESSCINREQGSTSDYLPAAYGGNLQKYVSDFVLLANWPGGLGNVLPIPKNWFVLWDHVANENTTSYIGYYAAQSDPVMFGEASNARKDPCWGFAGSTSCAPVVKHTLADDCLPVGTPLGTITSLGPLGPVPVPVLRAMNIDPVLGFSDPAGTVTVEWVPACVSTHLTCT